LDAEELGGTLKTAPIDANQWFAARQAATLLEVTELTVCKYCRAGEFGDDARKLGPRQSWHVRGAGIIRKRKEWGLDVARNLVGRRQER